MNEHHPTVEITGFHAFYTLMKYAPAARAGMFWSMPLNYAHNKESFYYLDLMYGEFLMLHSCYIVLASYQ